MGVSPAEIGLLTGVAPLVSAFSSAAAGAYADSQGAHRTLLLSSIAGGALLHCMLPFVQPRLSSLLPLVLLAEFVAAPAVPLADAAIGLTLSDNGYTFADYGKQRLWGAVSWGFIFAPAVGATVAFTRGRLREAAPYIGHVLSSMGSWRAARRLHTPPAGARSAAETGALAAALRGASATPGFRQRLCLFLALGAALGCMDTFLFVLLRELGGGTWLDGVALTVTCVSETAIFFYAGDMERAMGTTGCLHVVIVCYVVRLLYYSALPFLPSPWWVLPAQLLHGVTFGLYWAVGNSYMRAVAPPGMHSSLQSLFQGLTQAGSFMGLLVAGALVQAIGCARMFLAFAGMVAAAHALFFYADDAVDGASGGAEDGTVGEGGKGEGVN